MADALAVVAVLVALWAPLAVIADAPLALAAGFGGVALSTGAGCIDRANARAPIAFLIVLAVGAVALILHWTTS